MTFPSVPAPAGLDISVRHDSADGPALIVVSGEIDVGTAGQLVGAVTHALTGLRPAAIVVDLGAVTFLDAYAAGQLLAARALAGGHGVDLRIINVRGLVLQVLTFTGLLDTLTGTAASAPAAV